MIFFNKKVALIRTIMLVLLITKLHFKGLKRSTGEMGAKKIKIDVFENKSFGILLNEIMSFLKMSRNLAFILVHT
jgi:hypothetical protein